MKKLTFSAFVFAVLCFTGCGSDDDNKNVIEACQTCNLEILGETIISEFCDNGDGTITITAFGQEEIEELDEGVTFAEFIAAYEEFGAICN
ncbi:hypothetical protein [Litoribaculum gwangyangense]